MRWLLRIAAATASTYSGPDTMSAFTARQFGLWLRLPPDQQQQQRQPPDQQPYKFSGAIFGSTLGHGQTMIHCIYTWSVALENVLLFNTCRCLPRGSFLKRVLELEQTPLDSGVTRKTGTKKRRIQTFRCL
jgi:hypothetical protein